MIPKIIHQIWIQGYTKIPSELEQNHFNCKNINDNFTHMFWDEVEIKKLLSRYFDKKYSDLYDYYNIPAQRADLVRYAILYVYGGIYLDMDMVCKKNLSCFLMNKLFFTTDVFYFLYKRYLTGIIGAEKKHPLFNIIMENMILRKKYAHSNVAYSTGTKLFYDSVLEYVKKTNDNDISIIDRKYLHPCSILDDKTCADNCDSCYVAHTNYSSWSPSIKFLKYVSNNTLLITIGIIILTLLLIIFYESRI